jgi:hypothetical protein
VPLVFAESEETESGIKYADKTGIIYEFPRAYRRLIQPGELFVYYRGRKRSKGGRQPQVYFGTGVVGEVGPAPDESRRLVCGIVDYRSFVDPVPFKTAAAGYLEFSGARRGYFQQGVRTISVEEFENILAIGFVSGDRQPLSRPSSSGRKDRGETRQAAIARMAATAVQTAADANGQEVSVRKKTKNLLLTELNLQQHIGKLLDSQANRCAITGLQLQFGDTLSDPAMLCSLDRIDSSKHYELGNLQVVCRFVNKWKSASNDAEFRRLIEILRSTLND